MKHSFTRSLLITVFTLFSFTAMAQSGETYSQVVKRYFIATNSEKTVQAMFDQIFKTLEAQSPNAPKEFWSMMKQELQKDVLNQFTEMLTPVYQKYLTQKELEAVVAFYESPAGQKMASVIPNLTTESMSVGQEWGAAVFSKVMAKMKEKGYSK